MIKLNKLSINLVIKGALYNGRLGAYIMLRDKGPNVLKQIEKETNETKQQNRKLAVGKIDGILACQGEFE